MTRPANGDVATPSLMKPIRSDLPRARLRANALEWYPRRSATLRTLRRVFSGIRTFLLSLIAHDAVAVETPAACDVLQCDFAHVLLPLRGRGVGRVGRGGCVGRAGQGDACGEYALENWHMQHEHRSVAQDYQQEQALRHVDP